MKKLDLVLKRINDLGTLITGLSQKSDLLTKGEIQQMTAELDEKIAALEIQVTNTIGIENSALTLLNGVAAQIAQLSAELTADGIDATKVQALSDSLAASSAQLAAAVAANTPPPTG